MRLHIIKSHQKVPWHMHLHAIALSKAAQAHCPRVTHQNTEAAGCEGAALAANSTPVISWDKSHSCLRKSSSNALLLMSLDTSQSMKYLLVTPCRDGELAR